MRLPKIKQLPSGSYHCEVKANNKRISITEETEAECLAKAMVIISGRLTSSQTAVKARQQLTLRGAMDLYIQQRNNVLSPSTIYGYRAIQKHRFKSVIDVKIADVPDWQSVVNAEAKLVSAKTLRNAWGFASASIQNVKFDVDNVALPQIVKKEVAFYEPEEISGFLDVIHGEKYELSFLLCLHSLRASEVLAIDVLENIKDGYIHVSGAVVINEDSKLVRKETNKTEASNRKIPVMINRVNEIIEELGEKAQKQIPKTESCLTKNLKRISKDAKIKYVSPHGLRHTFASLCYSLQISEAMTMKFGGWSDAGVMRKIYTHLAEKDKTDAEEKLKGFFDSKNKKAGKNIRKVS